VPIGGHHDPHEGTKAEPCARPTGMLIIITIYSSGVARRLAEEFFLFYRSLMLKQRLFVSYFNVT